MKGAFDSTFARSVTVRDGEGEKRARAFIQPMKLQRPETPTITAAGIADERRWLLIMEPLTLQGRAEVVDGETHYQLLRWEWVGNKDHIEGVLKRRGGGSLA